MTMAAKASWPTTRLGELADFRNGVNYNKSSFGTGVKVVGVSDFQDYIKPRYEELKQINPEGIVTERNTLRDGDIVFVRSNGNRELIGFNTSSNNHSGAAGAQGDPHNDPLPLHMHRTSGRHPS